MINHKMLLYYIMKVHSKMIYLGIFIFFVSFVSLYPLKEGIKSKKKHKKDKKDKKHSKTETATRSKPTPYAKKVIDMVRKFPFYNKLPYSMRTMFENLLTFLIFI